MRKTAILFLLIAISFWGKSQDTLNFVNIEQQTAQYYFAAQWDSLIIVGNEGLEIGYDYFYLRLRLGVAYYYQGKYSKAIIHLEKARLFNTQDEFANSYLYLSYKYMGRNADAEIIGKTLSDTLRTQPLFKKTPLFSGAYIELGFSPASTYVPTILAKNSPNLSESSTKNNALQYGFVGLINQVTPWLSLFYGYTSLSTSLTKTTYEKQIPPFTPKLNTTLSDISVNQQQFYINPRIRIARGLVVSTYYQKINISSVLQGNPPKADTTITFNDGILGISLEKYYRNFVFNGEISNNKLNNINHLQMQLGASWYPLFNQNFYLCANYASNSAKGNAANFSPTYEKRKSFFTVKAGGKLLKNLWGETAYYGGNVQDSQIANGFLFFNTPNNIKMMANATLTVVLNKIKISLKYQFANQTSTKESSTIMNPTTINYSTYSFNQQTITGGLLWNF